MSNTGQTNEIEIFILLGRWFRHRNLFANWGLVDSLVLVETTKLNVIDSMHNLYQHACKGNYSASSLPCSWLMDCYLFLLQLELWL